MKFVVGVLLLVFDRTMCKKSNPPEKNKTKQNKNKQTNKHTNLLRNIFAKIVKGGDGDIMVNVVENRHGDPGSNSERDYLLFS